MKPHLYRRLSSFGLIYALLIVSILPATAALPPVTPELPREQALPGWFALPEPAGNLPPLPPETLAKIEPALLKRLLLEKGPRIRFIVHMEEQANLTEAAGQIGILERRQQVIGALQTTAERTQTGIRTMLAQEEIAGRATDVRPYWIFNGLALTGSRETAFALAARPEVNILRLDHQRHLPGDFNNTTFPAERLNLSSGIEWNIERIRAPLVWDALDFDGADVVVANLDSGVDWLHPALQSSYRGYDPHGMAHQHTGNWFDAIEGALYPVDGNGHGTHTMGTLVGKEGIGVAPGARWIAARAFSSAGFGYDSWIHAAFEWLLAPEGNPALAPDVINNSWGNNTGSNEAFRDDVRALNKAGIISVFSAGNVGPNSGTINSPGSYPEALAVGATDADDEIADFSSRGPSHWGEIKPEISAPGVSIRSALPGGAYGSKQGTSMAAPHVAGVIALILQADASLTITAVEEALISTAMPLPAAGSVPNNDYGWGRVDAYGAVMAVAARGILSGVVTDAGNSDPIPQVTVSATPTEGGATVQAITDEQGRYTVGLHPGQWNLTASAFGYASQIENRIELFTGTTTVQDFALTVLPAGLLSGTVTQAGSNAPLSATLVIEGTPAQAATDPATGGYNLNLPAGVYTISVHSTGHRVSWATTVPITVGQTTIRHFSLITAPTILLVDSGAWSYKSQVGYYQTTLDALNYQYEIHTVKNLPDDVPATADLLPYDVVIWSAPNDAPGYIGASEAITHYLESGGLLLLSGQDIAFWDGGGSNTTFSSYFQNYMNAVFVSDNTATRQITGQSGEIFDGLSFSIEDGDGAGNQIYPDVIKTYDPDYATSVLGYQDNGSAGQSVGLCRPYRILYLSFGFEGIDNAASRQQVMSRSIDWLTSPRQARGVELAPQTRPSQIAPPGETITHLLRLRNTGETEPTDTYDLILESTKGWNHALSDDSFVLPSCQTATLTLTVQIPPTAGWDETETITITARSRSDSSITATTVVIAKTPAPILLVDDDRWHDQQARYTAALQASGYHYDVWDVRERGWSSPDSDIVDMYPIILWYTAYDWYSPLTTGEETRLMQYLNAGGRLFFSSQDYLYLNGLTALGEDYFGLAGYTEDITSTMATGINGHPVGDRLGTFLLNYPFHNWSDTIEPAQVTDTAFIGRHNEPIGLAHANENHKAIFFSFPFETLNETARAIVIERVVGWLSWLGESTFQANTGLAAGGERVTYTLTLQNDGPANLSGVSVTNTLPLSLSLVPGSLAPPEASYTGGEVHWQGAMAQGKKVVINYQAQIASPMPAASLILNPAQIHIVDHHLKFSRTTRTRVNAPDLDNSLYLASQDTARPGETLTYTLVLRNDGLADTPPTWILTNPVPSNTTLVPSSLALQGGGSANETDGVITWTGTLFRAQPVTLTYQIVITNYAGYDIVGYAWLTDGYGEEWEKTTLTAVPYFKTHLPFISKNFKPSFWPQQTP